MSNPMPQQLSIPAGGGESYDGYLYPAPSGRAPGIVMIPEIFGVNPPLRDIAARFAAQGYAVLLIDAFWRLERNVSLDYDKAGAERARALHGRFDYDQGVVDVLAAVDFLRAQPGCNGAVSIVGFCFGGTLAYLAAARGSPDAAVSYYATRIQGYLDDAPKVHMPLLLHFAELDHTTPPEVLAKILPAVAGNPSITSHVYAGEKHGFANHRLPAYSAEATGLADLRTFEFLHKHLLNAVDANEPKA
jgi:carboxymethylenebutenolidase